MKLFQDFVEPPKPVRAAKIPRPKGKRKAKILIRSQNSKENPFAVDFEGFNEGSGSPCANEEEVQEDVEKLKQRHAEIYDIKVIDEREPHIRFSYLNEYKQFIIDLCKEREEQEIAKAKERSDSVWVDTPHYEPEIWFDTSIPYDCSLNVRMKSHKCYYHCVEFRFQKGILQAWDNGFQSSMGHGTNMLFSTQHQTHLERKEIIRGIMERVLNNECCKDANETKQRIHKTDEYGWILSMSVAPENGVDKDA